MRVARISLDHVVYLARIDGEKAVPVYREPASPGGDVLREALAAADGDLARLAEVAEPVSLESCRLLSPVRAPEKIVCIGLNYADHARESGVEPPSAPMIFAKFAGSIVGPGDPVRYRTTDSQQVDYEAELAAVIGRAGRDISAEDALDHVFGYTCANDVSARDAQFADNQWVRGKSFDTFCPLGPWIVTGDELGDVQQLGVRCRVNGETLQDGTTADMIFDVATLVSYCSRYFTLVPGDVILTGTPYGVGFARTPPRFLVHGDTVEVDIDGIGVLRNVVEVDA